MPVPDPNPCLPLDAILQAGLNLTVECYIGPDTGWVPCPMIDGHPAFALHTHLPKRLPLLRGDVCDHIARVLGAGVPEEETRLSCGCLGGCPENRGYTAQDGAERCPKCRHPLGGFLPRWVLAPASVEPLMGRSSGGPVGAECRAALLAWSYQSWSRGGPVIRRLYAAPDHLGTRKILLCEPECQWKTDDFSAYWPARVAVLDRASGDLTLPPLPPSTTPTTGVPHG